MTGNETTTSLIKPEREQLELLRSTEIPGAVFAEEENESRKGGREFTAARFFAWSPEKYREILSLRAEGVPIASIARMYHVSPGTVTAIERREQGTAVVGEAKQRALLHYSYLIRLSCERLEEILIDPEAKFPPQQLAVIIGVLQDKVQLLQGEPTARVEVTGTPAVESYLGLLNQARHLMAERMGFGGDGAGQKGEAPAGGLEAGGAGSAAAAGDQARVIDVEVGPAHLSDDQMRGGAIVEDSGHVPA